ncbi:MAG TPA: bifunctional UDP-N-acetylmuramoyl-tripeptide:D-alanyl-D-alanine ligase/alanine racemase [Chitinophagaceae bacterium]|jgi:alanine racemase|nr:bifunctional UDP-N-acetylmuramoyl-tripeptide:D-alanyl-D-alanine ligase/alanine racemase [Chitinophagaceae bacterium]
MKVNKLSKKLSYTVSDITIIIGAEGTVMHDTLIEHLLLDSRKTHSPSSSLFFAIRGVRRDGHQFIPELYKKGVRSFVISETIETSVYPDSNFLLVDDTLVALQLLAAHHRSRFNIPVIGITGSNGKTIVKEWLYQLLHADHSIVRNPKSYNSQIGVPLSVWQMNEQHELALFEAGISEFGEMLRLEKIIRPTLGVLTNIGEAHSEGFNDTEHKFREKMVLFRNTKTVIGRAIDLEGREEVIDMLGDELTILTWGTGAECDFVVKAVEKQEQHTSITINREGQECNFNIPFTDEASVENAITCACVLLELKTDPAVITGKMSKLHPVNMRLELKKGINHCSIINDSYSADLSSLEIALNFLDQQSSNEKKTVILSDFLQSSIERKELYDYILESLQKHKVNRLIGIGPAISENLSMLAVSQEQGISIELFSSTEGFIQQFRSSQFKEEAILVKGARAFAFEAIVQLLEQKAHQTVLEINLNAIAHNLREYQAILEPSTKIMAMVKAFAYGSGGAEIAGILQYHKVDYLGVAYADEGVELRKAGITLPVMVMNPEATAFESIVEHNLEPELYSFELMSSFDQFIQQEGLEHYPVHIEIETGMNRLGFATGDMEKLASALKSGTSFRVQSVFSHLAASEEAAQDAFTIQQYELFDKASKELQERTGYSFVRHIANSAAAVRHPQLQMDMIRLGIGMYGVDSSGTGKLDLQTVATLRSTIAQIRRLKKGDSVSYNRKGVVENDSLIATVRIGYADGYPRRLGNGAGKVWIKNKLAPVIGTVCMDMFMIDITGIPGVREGDDVVIFGEQLPVQEMAQWAGTIPYEIMTGVSQRVKRVYFEE